MFFRSSGLVALFRVGAAVSPEHELGYRKAEHGDGGRCGDHAEHAEPALELFADVRHEPVELLAEPCIVVDDADASLIVLGIAGRDQSLHIDILGGDVRLVGVDVAGGILGGEHEDQIAELADVDVQHLPVGSAYLEGRPFIKLIVEPLLLDGDVVKLERAGVGDAELDPDHVLLIHGGGRDGAEGKPLKGFVDIRTHDKAPGVVPELGAGGIRPADVEYDVTHLLGVVHEVFDDLALADGEGEGRGGDVLSELIGHLEVVEPLVAVVREIEREHDSLGSRLADHYLLRELGLYDADRERGHGVGELSRASL